MTGNIRRYTFFQKFSLLTLVAIWLLILVGGIVRATGSGMGCPDWPKCFGVWIPPTSVEQLPANYQEIYGHRGYKDVEFNAVKTWIEYINRLIGVLAGLFVVGLSYQSLKTKHKVLIALSLASLVLIVFQGWLGSVVVATVLKPMMISLHMLVALVIIALVMFAYIYSKNLEEVQQVKHFASIAFFIKMNIIILVASFIQVFLGIGVREQVDYLVNELSIGREYIIDNLNFIFYIHRSFSLVILALFVWLTVTVGNQIKGSTLEKLNRLTGLFIVLNIGTGVLFNYFKFPAFAQPLHLLFGISLLLSVMASVFLAYFARSISSAYTFQAIHQ
jgi:cytochrome c oxidase assembly protein subunit 15